MTKKSFITLLMLLTIIAGDVLAQGRGKGKLKNKNPEQRAEIKTKRLMKPLTLSEDQATKIKAVHLTAENQLASIRADRSVGKLTKEEVKSKRLAINKTRHQGIRAVLDTQQKYKYRRWRIRRMSPKKRARIKTRRLVKPLNLTAAQRPKVRQVHLTAERKLNKVRAGRRSKQITKEAAKTQRMAIRKARRKGLKAIFNANQKAKYKAWRKKRDEKRKAGGDVDDDITDEDLDNDATGEDDTDED
ncbi:hypothetical protein BKI52_24770 [marine bacterium AO1-C]|nr:hypothetical protein BKI52_24770 [marine bacterium AO1-C]